MSETKAQPGTCEACRYWSSHAEFEDGKVGDCRLKPPERVVPHVDGDSARGEVGGSVVDDYGWPVTQDEDWCGQWQARAGT